MMTLHEFLNAPGPAALLGVFVAAWHLPTPRECWMAVQTYRSLKGAFPVIQNPLAFITAVLTLGEDATKLYTDVSQHDKAAAVAAALDALPALATVTGKPLADIQAVITPEGLAIAYDVEQDAVAVLPLLEAALAKYHAG